MPFNGNRKHVFFSAAGLISRFYEGCPVNEIYDKGVRYYDILLHLLENPDAVESLSGLTKIPPEKIRSAALKIIHLLMFNRNQNPYLTLGLPDQATAADVKHRWKRLLLLIHPDRSPSFKGNETMTRRINEAYRNIANLGPNDVPSYSHEDRNTNESAAFTASYAAGGNMHVQSLLSRHYKYLRHLPTIIVITAVSLAFLSLLIFILLK
ncbi:MAG: J domain-containing protein [Nitrospirota bacterium]